MGRLPEKCSKCPNPAAPGHASCEDHLRKKREQGSARRDVHRAKGLCLQCDEPALTGRSMCEKHARRCMKNGGPVELPAPKPWGRTWPALTGDNAREWYNRLVEQTIAADRRLVPPQHHEDFAQDVRMKLLEAGTFEAAVAQAGLVEQKFRGFVAISAHRHALNWLRGYGRKLSRFLPADPASIDATNHPDLTTRVDAEEVPLARHVLREFARAFPEDFQRLLQRDGSLWYPLHAGRTVQERRDILDFLTKHGVCIPLKHIARTPRVRQGQASLALSRALLDRTVQETRDEIVQARQQYEARVKAANERTRSAEARVVDGDVYKLGVVNGLPVSLDETSRWSDVTLGDDLYLIGTLDKDGSAETHDHEHVPEALLFEVEHDVTPEMRDALAKRHEGYAG